MKKTVDVWMNGEIQSLAKQEIAGAYERGELKSLGFVGVTDGETRAGFDVLYWSGIYVVVIDVTTHRVHVSKMIYRPRLNEIQFKVDSETFSTSNGISHLE